MKITRRIVILIVLSAVILATGWVYIRHGQDDGLEKVQISQAFQHLLYIGLYVARDEGFFEEQGLDVSVSTAGGDAQTFAALTSGEVQFAQGDPAFVAIGNEQGWDGRVVVMAVDRAAVWGITFDDQIKPFDEITGFKGLTVGTFPNPNTSYIIQKRLIEGAGLKLGEDTNIVELQFGSEIAAAKAGRVDIAHTIEPNATQVTEQGGRVVFSYPDAFGPLAFTGLMTSKELIDTRPDLVQKVVSAYEKAFRTIARDRAVAVRIAKKQLPNLDEKTIRSALDRLLNSGAIPKHARVNEASWEKLLDIRVDVGDIEKRPRKSLINNIFAEKAFSEVQ